MSIKRKPFSCGQSLLAIKGLVEFANPKSAMPTTTNPGGWTTKT
jgi:hypothetical protein